MRKTKISARLKRKMHVRKNVSGTPDCPRLTVFRSNKHIYAQIIDDVNSLSIVGKRDVATKKSSASKTKSELSKEVGLEIAKLAKEKNISKVVFDRNGYKYHGRVMQVAEGAREGGLVF